MSMMPLVSAAHVASGVPPAQALNGAATPPPAAAPPANLWQPPPLTLRTAVFVPRGARLDVAALRAQLAAHPAADHAYLRRAAAVVGGQAVGLVEQLLHDAPAADVRRHLGPQAPGRRRSLHLVAAYVGGGTAAMADVAAGRDRPHLLSPRAVGAWRRISRPARAVFAGRGPGSAALLRALDELATGRSSVSPSEYQMTLRFLLLALVHGGLHGLGLTLRAMGQVGGVHLRLGRQATAPREEANAPPRVVLPAGPAGRGPNADAAAAVTPVSGQTLPARVGERFGFRPTPPAGRWLPLSAERTVGAANTPPPYTEAEAAHVLLTLRGCDEPTRRPTGAWRPGPPAEA